MASTHDNPIAQRILHAAVRLFAQKGYAATTTREIVEAAQVTKPMLYYYFESKEGLCRAALQQFLEQFEERLRRLLEEPREPLEQLVAVVWAHLDFCQEHMDIARLFFALFFGPPEETAWLNLDRYAKAGNELMMLAIDKAARSGLLRPRSQQAFRLALDGMINIHIIGSLKENAPLTHKLARQIVEDLLGGFGRH